MQVKKEECVLYAMHGQARAVWFDDKDSIIYFTDTPFAKVRWSYGIIKSKQQALNHYREMKKTNWEMVTDNIHTMIPKLQLP